MKTAFRLMMASLLFLGTASQVNAQSPEVTHNAWTSGAALPTAVVGPTAGVVKNEIYVVGGQNADGATIADVQVYNPATDTWSAGLSYPIGIQEASAATNTWTEEAPMLGTKASPAAGLLGTTIVASGGAVQPGQITGDTEGYDAATNTWTELTAAPTARVFSCFGSVGAKFYEAGGYLNNAGAGTTLNEYFQVSKNKWTPLAPMPQGSMLGASAVYKKQLYCMGGWATWKGTPINNVQIYQP